MADLLKELNEQQREVVKATHGPVLVLAGAGSGKTRALTYRIAYLVQQRIAKPPEILAVTFTNKAAGEMKERVAKLTGGRENMPRWVGTFHGIGAKMLREQAKSLPRSPGFTIFGTDESERLVRMAMDHLKISRKEFNPRHLRHRISDAKSKFKMPREVMAEATRAEDEALGVVYQRYENLLAKHDAYDFDDLIVRNWQMLNENEGIRLFYQQRWRWLSVDEYQDTSPLQDSLLKLLTGPEKNICAVGDDYQSIYSWRGAKVDHILNFASSFNNCRTIYLTQNYRSTKAILKAANEVIAENKKQKHKKLWTEAEAGTPIRIIEVPSSSYEAHWLRADIEEHIANGGKRSDCVALYRTNAQSRALEEQFLSYGIPYTVVGGFRFYERKEVKDALALLQLWNNPRAVLALERIAQAMWYGIGPKTIKKWDQDAEEQGVNLFDILNTSWRHKKGVGALLDAFSEVQKCENKTVKDILESLLHKSGYEAWLKKQPDGAERWENIEELLNVTANYADPEQFLEEISLLSDIDTFEGEQDRVTCMTLHAAKGLEFNRVYITGCEENLLPHVNSLMNADQVEEERRLLYVGMTRARRELTIIHARYRLIRGAMQPQAPSRFLTALEGLPWCDKINMAGQERQDTVIGGDEEDDFGLWQDDGEPAIVAVEDGNFVQHKKFGQGVVIGVKGRMVTCVFKNYGVKTIDAAHLMAHAGGY